MRKLISLGLLALLWSLLASPVVANDENDCDDVIDGTPGLYGLCIAYHHAGNDNAKQKILDNYNRKKGPLDLPMPRTEPEIATATATCPCLDDSNVIGIEDWGFLVGSCTSDEGTDQGLFLNLEHPVVNHLTTWFTTSTDGVVYMCDITQSPGLSLMLPISEAEYDECLSQLLALCP